MLKGDITNGDTLNRYAYVLGNPVSFIDSFGLSADIAYGDYDSKYCFSGADVCRSIANYLMSIDGKKYSEIGHTILDLAGMIPGIGMVADAINDIWYVVEGRWGDAGLSALAFVPIVGDAAVAGKFGLKAQKIGKAVAKWGDNAVKAISKYGDEAIEALCKGGKKAKSLISSASKKVGKAADKVGGFFKSAASKTVGFGKKAAKKASGWFDDFWEEGEAVVLHEDLEPVSRTRWGKEHGKGNTKHNNAIETELDNAFANGATDIRKNRVQRDVNGNRVYAPDGKYTKPDASYVKDGVRYNTNYISNYELDNVEELNREIDTFNRMCDADPSSITCLKFKY